MMKSLQIYICASEADTYGNTEETVNHIAQLQGYLAYILTSYHEIECVFIDSNQQIEEGGAVIFIPVVSEASSDDLAWVAKVESFTEKIATAPEALTIALTSSNLEKIPAIISDRELQKLSIESFQDINENEETLDKLLFTLFDLSTLISNKFLKVKKKKSKAEKTIKVFLADTSKDLNLAREVIRRELISRGVEVLPKEELPTQEETLEEQMMLLLKECKLSIHLFGSTPSGKYSDAGILMEDAQNKIAARFSHQEEGAFSGFQRLIWMPHRLKPEDKEQEVLLAQLQKDNYLKSKADLIRSSIEELKDVIENAIFASKKQKYSANKKEQEAIYIIQKNASKRELNQLSSLFEKHGFNVIISNHLDDAYESLIQHRNYLFSCSSVLLLYKKGEQTWLRSKMNDILKIKNHRKVAYQFKAIGFWEDDLNMEDAIFEGVKWIDMREGFTVDTILELV